MDRRTHLREIATAALERVDPYRMVQRCLRIEDGKLRVATERSDHLIPLPDFTKLFVLGAGKAAAPMAQAIEALLGERIDKGLMVIKPGHGLTLQRIRAVEGGHPVPDEKSVAAAAALVALADEADEKTLVINLVSGGGSALLSSPLEFPGHPVTLAEMQATTRALLACGATIQEINCIRKHLLSLAGGRLAERIFPGTTLSLILSDVVGDDVQIIASGPTAPDASTYDEACAIVEHFDIASVLPASVVELLRAGRRGEIPETPKPGSPPFARALNILVGTNLFALEAARHAAERLGYHTTVLTSRLVGEAREVAKVLAAIAKDVAAFDLGCVKPACILAGGETTVTVHGGGTGGRNQEMALAYLLELARDREGLDGTAFLSFSTDGEDGPTEAAGAFADAGLMEGVRTKGLSIPDYLRDNDSHGFFAALDGLLLTGPTNTNVCDIQIVLIP